MSITTVISLVLTLLPQILEGAGVIPASLQALIASLGASLPGLITALTKGGSTTDAATAALSGIQTEINTLMASGTLSTAKLEIASSLTKALAAALAGYKDAETETDPSALTPLPETL